MIINVKLPSAFFGRNEKYLVWNGVKALFDKPCTQLSTDSVDNSIKSLISHEVKAFDVMMAHPGYVSDKFSRLPCQSK
jgi:hypothetical protein